MLAHGATAIPAGAMATFSTRHAARPVRNRETRTLMADVIVEGLRLDGGERGQTNSRAPSEREQQISLIIRNENFSHCQQRAGLIEKRKAP